MFYTNLTWFACQVDLSASWYFRTPSPKLEIPPACPADRSVSRYEKRSIYACRPRITLSILRPHRRGRNGGRARFRSRLRAFKWRPCCSTDCSVGFQRWWLSGCSEKPNDPPGKPAGFVYNNEAVRPAVELQLNAEPQGDGGLPSLAPTCVGLCSRFHRGPYGPVALNFSILLASVGPAPAEATTGGLHQDATGHLRGTFAALRRACPGGSATCKLRPCQLNRCSRRGRPDGERDIFLALVANQL